MQMSEAGERSRAEDPDRLRKEILITEGRLADLRASLAAQVNGTSSSTSQPVDGRVVGDLLRARRTRERVFGADLFSDPAWDLLLHAYAAYLAQHRLPVSTLCGVTNVSESTALRWIRKLEQESLLIRRDDHLDRRRSWIELSPQAADKLNDYFGAHPWTQRG